MIAINQSIENEHCTFELRLQTLAFHGGIFRFVFSLCSLCRRIHPIWRLEHWTIKGSFLHFLNQGADDICFHIWSPPDDYSVRKKNGIVMESRGCLSSSFTFLRILMGFFCRNSSSVVTWTVQTGLLQQFHCWLNWWVEICLLVNFHIARATLLFPDWSRCFFERFPLDFHQDETIGTGNRQEFHRRNKWRALSLFLCRRQ